MGNCLSWFHGLNQTAQKPGFNGAWWFWKQDILVTVPFLQRELEVQILEAHCTSNRRIFSRLTIKLRKTLEQVLQPKINRCRCVFVNLVTNFETIFLLIPQYNRGKWNWMFCSNEHHCVKLGNIMNYYKESKWKTGPDIWRFPKATWAVKRAP